MSVPCSGPYCVLADWLSGFPRQGGTAGWAPSARAWQGQAASAGPTTWRYRPGLSWTPTGQALPLGLHVCQRRAPGRPCALRTNAHLVAGGGHPHLAADALRSTGVLLDIRKGKPHLELPRPGLSVIDNVVPCALPQHGTRCPSDVPLPLSRPLPGSPALSQVADRMPPSTNEDQPRLRFCTWPVSPLGCE